MDPLVDYEKQVYAAALGKVIGVYLGRPFEGWPRERIQEKWGEITRYVHEDVNVPLIVSDDDISGTFTFVRALSDSGELENTPADFFGKTWLNYLIENKTILWWGGMSHSTEHTAFLRLKSGVPSPESGSMKRNGREVSEQIGAQIFIDAFGMVAPGRPELAVELARHAAEVSHDGEAVYAARVVAAMVSLAFVEKEMDALLDASVKFIPETSLIAQVHRDVRKWASEYPDWNDTYLRIKEKYGYDTYGGNCHVVPNHAVMVMAWAYGQRDFFKALSIASTAGWDTDCNAGNVGTVSALVAGLEHLNDRYEFHGPFADRIYLPTADGTDSVTDVLRIAWKIAGLGRKLMRWPILPAPKHNAWFHFEMPGALHGFMPRENGFQGQNNVLLRNVPAPEDFEGTRCLEFRFRCGIGQKSMAETLLAYSQSNSYAVVSTPVIGGGTSIRIKGRMQVPTPAKVRLYLALHGNGILVSDEIPCTPAGEMDFEWIPQTDGMAERLGIEVDSETPCHGTLLVDSIHFGGQRAFRVASLTADAFGWISSMDDTRGSFSNDHLEDMRYWIKNNEGGVLVTGTRNQGNTRFSCNFKIHAADRAGILLHYQGLQRWIGLLFTRTALQIVRNNYGETVLAEIPFACEENKLMHLEAVSEEGRISLAIDGQRMICAQDSTFMAGGAGLYIDRGMAGMCDVALSQKMVVS